MSLVSERGGHGYEYGVLIPDCEHLTSEELLPDDPFWLPTTTFQGLPPTSRGMESQQVVIVVPEARWLCLTMGSVQHPSVLASKFWVALFQHSIHMIAILPVRL